MPSIQAPSTHNTLSLPSRSAATAKLSPAFMKQGSVQGAGTEDSIAKSQPNFSVCYCKEQCKIQLGKGSCVWFLYTLAYWAIYPAGYWRGKRNPLIFYDKHERRHGVGSAQQKVKETCRTLFRIQYIHNSNVTLLQSKLVPIRTWMMLAKRVNSSQLLWGYLLPNKYECINQGCTIMGRHAICLLNVAMVIWLDINKNLIIHCQCLSALGLPLMRTPQSELTMRPPIKRSHYFHASQMVLLREAHHTTADVLTMTQLSCMAI